MCAETDSKSKKSQRQSMDDTTSNKFETMKGNSSLMSKSLLEEEEEEEQEEYDRASLPSIKDDVRDTESEPYRGFSFDRSQFASDFSAFSDPILCAANDGLCNGPLFEHSKLTDQIEMMTVRATRMRNRRFESFLRLFQTNTDPFFFSFLQQGRHPMELFSLFNEHAVREGVESGMPTAYELPTDCEYCGSELTKNCPEDCQRPRSLFRKKRPPFCPRGEGWDPRTEHEIKREKGKAKEPEGVPHRERTASPFMALSGFFASPGTEQ
jgi:hypothetical protein